MNFTIKRKNAATSSVIVTRTLGGQAVERGNPIVQEGFSSVSLRRSRERSDCTTVSWVTAGNPKGHIRTAVHACSLSPSDYPQATASKRLSPSDYSQATTSISPRMQKSWRIGQNVQILETHHRLSKWSLARLPKSDQMARFCNVLQV